ncbi:MAG: hypothetical protein EBZ62_08240 [Sphingobacteriia bacterium]|nr:hypothetical protein [Sphingobacteriia bacterium]
MVAVAVVLAQGVQISMGVPVVRAVVVEITMETAQEQPVPPVKAMPVVMPQVIQHQIIQQVVAAGPVLRARIHQTPVLVV